jgi:outer membrane protein assembly factor BamB
MPVKKPVCRLGSLILSIFMITGCNFAGRDSLVNPGKEEAIIVFLTGDVSVYKNKEWANAEIGEILKAGQSIKTPVGSYCEIQMGTKALVRIEEDTMMEISSLYDRKNGTTVDMSLTSGTVICKVNKLLDKEAFAVRTTTTVAGVRGTRFLVSTGDDETTMVAVSDGSVQIAPRVEMDELYALAADQETKILLDKITSDFPLVHAGEEVHIGDDSIRQVTVSFNNLLTVLQDNSLPDEAIRDEVKKSGLLLTGFGTKQELSGTNRLKLDSIEESPFRDFSAPDDRRPVSVVLKATPGSEILVNGVVAGMSIVSILVPAGTKLTAEARRPGYSSSKKELTATPRGPNIHTFEMGKIPDKVFTVTTEPSTAEIWLNGIKVGTGTYNGTLSGGDHGRVMVSAEGFNNRWVQILFDDNQGELLHIRLDPVINASFKPSGTKIIGLTAWQGGLIYGDYAGTLACMEQTGDKLWAVITGNTPIEASTPVLSGQSVAFSGLVELVLTDPATGKIRHRRKLAPTEQHIFGRHPVDARGTLVYPTNNGFLLLNPDTGDVLRSVEVSGGTRMTPLAFNGKIYIVNQEGIVYIYNQKGDTIGEIRTGAARPMALSLAVSGTKGYFADKEGHLVCLDLAADRVVWEKRISNDSAVPVSEDLSVGDNILVVWSRGALFGFAADTGKELWTTVDRYSAPPLVTGGFVYAGTNNGRLEVLKARNGEIYQTTPLSARATTRPILSGGMIWLGTDKGSLLEIRPLDPIP